MDRQPGWYDSPFFGQEYYGYGYGDDDMSGWGDEGWTVQGVHERDYADIGAYVHARPNDYVPFQAWGDYPDLGYRPHAPQYPDVFHYPPQHSDWQANRPKGPYPYQMFNGGSRGPGW